MKHLYNVNIIATLHNWNSRVVQSHCCKVVASDTREARRRAVEYCEAMGWIRRQNIIETDVLDLGEVVA